MEKCSGIIRQPLLLKTHVVGRFLFFLSIFIVTNMINKEFALRLSNHLSYVESRDTRTLTKIEIVGDCQNCFNHHQVRLSDAMEKLRGTCQSVVFSNGAVIQLLNAIQ